MSGESEETWKKKLRALDEENERLKSVLDSTIQLIRREHEAKLHDIEYQNTQRDAVVQQKPTTTTQTPSL